MDKERFVDKNLDSYSEKKLDLAIDKVKQDDQVKGGNIFDPQKKDKKDKSSK